MSLGSPPLREAPGFRLVALSAVPGFFRLRVPPSRPSPSPVPVVTGFGQELGVATGCMFVVGFFFSFLFFLLALWTPSFLLLLCVSCNTQRLRSPVQGG